MRHWLTRLLALALIAAACSAALGTLKKRRNSASDRVGPAAEWPPFASPPPSGDPPPEQVTPDIVEQADAAATAQWVTAVDGQCPDGYPIKAKVASRIFHVPGGRFYDKAVPERCYASVEAAERDGYRQAKA